MPGKGRIKGCAVKRIVLRKHGRNGEKIMAYYLVDYENVKADGMYGVDQLGKKDCVCIFYSENASTLTFGLHEKLNQTKGKIVLQKVEVGVKNALDFQLSTYLGYLISENEGKNETYYIVSEDKGLAILTGYWAERGENVKTASDIAAAKEDLEEEKTSKAEKKEKKEKTEKTEKTEKVEKESGGEKEEPDQQKKFHGKRQQKKGNAHSVQTTRLQVHTRKQETKSQNPVQQESDAENTEIPVAEKMLTEEKQEQQVKETAVRQENNGTEIRKPEHRKYRKYRNYRKYPQKNRKTQESSKVIRPILSAGE